MYRSVNGGLSFDLYNNSFSPANRVIGISKDAGTGDTLIVSTNKSVYKVWAPYIQGPDTSFTDYFPLAVGNVWVYDWIYNGYPTNGGTTRIRISTDTVVNSVRYYKLTLPVLETRFFRVDSITGNIYSYSPLGGCSYHPNETLVDSLASKINDTTSFCGSVFRKCSFSGILTFFSNQYPTKVFEPLYVLTAETRAYAKGLGLYGMEEGDPYTTRYTLRGCVINGILYGDTTTYHNVSGYITYSDNNQPVLSGYVKALKYDYINDKVITVDSSQINNGYYSLSRCTQDSLDIMAYGNDEEADFVPTYHDTTIYWQQAQTVYPSGNLTNVNIKVHRRVQTDSPASNFISGGVYRALLSPNDALKDAIVYAKYGGIFVRAGITIANGYYIVDSLPPGTCELVTDRIGYYSDYKTLQVGQSVLDTINFYLTRVTGLTKEFSSSIPTSFKLHQNYPNPFNPLTTLKIDVPPIHNNPPARFGGKGVFVSVKVYDVIGREVAVLLAQDMTPGTYTITWNASNYASGLYFYKMIADEYVETRKMVLIK